MHLKNQPPVLVSESYSAELEKFSKAALMDIAWSFASRCAGVDYNQFPRQVYEEFSREADAILAVRKHERARP